MQSISIRNLGPIKEFDYEIKDLTLLIGAQGSGKSTIAKAVYFFRTVKDVVSEELDGLFREPAVPFSLGAVELRLKELLYEFFGEGYFGEGTKVKYDYEVDRWVEVGVGTSHIEIVFSDQLKQSILDLVDSLKIQIQDDKGQPSANLSIANRLLRPSALIDSKASALDGIFFLFGVQQMILAGRSRFAAYEGRIDYYQLNRRNFLDDYFLREIEDVRRFVLRPHFTENTENRSEAIGTALSLAKQILGGEVKRVGEEDRFFFSEGKSLEIRQISSGQQEALWLVNLLVKIIAERSFNEFVIIEEPEAHLHPEAQFLLCKLIGLAMSGGGAHFIINTHSPYILAAFNNMLLGAKVGKEKPEEAVAILPQKFWIDHERVFAGEVENGTVEDILDQELAMIKLEQLDTISRTINDEFDRLSDLEDVPLDPDLAAYLKENSL
jgi:AAA domain, putative AbiEii toxin, Type IV TA system